MALLQRLAKLGPLYGVLARGGKAVVYATFEPLEGDAVFDVPNASMREGIEDDAPASGDFIDWGPAEFFRVRVAADQNSATDGILVEVTNNGEDAVSTPVLEEDYTAASGEYNSGWLPIEGIGFRFSYTNGAVPQTSFFAIVEVSGETNVVPPSP